MWSLLVLIGCQVVVWWIRVLENFSCLHYTNEHREADDGDGEELDGRHQSLSSRSAASQQNVGVDQGSQQTATLVSSQRQSTEVGSIWAQSAAATPNSSLQQSEEVFVSSQQLRQQPAASSNQQLSQLPAATNSIGNRHSAISSGR